jgi:hypothetical protein
MVWYVVNVKWVTKFKFIRLGGSHFSMRAFNEYSSANSYEPEKTELFMRAHLRRTTKGHDIARPCGRLKI